MCIRDSPYAVHRQKPAQALFERRRAFDGRFVWQQYPCDPGPVSYTHLAILADDLILAVYLGICYDVSDGDGIALKVCLLYTSRCV